MTPPSKAKRLIITADDFGLSVPVNEAVQQAHRHGTLSAASLMVGAPEAKDAVARARSLETLGVGLHLTLLDGRPTLPPEQIPGLVGSDGRFHRDPFSFGVALFFSSALRRQARAEIAAQFQRFGETGLVMDHVNGHKHFHLHPVVLEEIVRLAPSFGSPPVRIPREPFGPSFRASRDRLAVRLASSLFYLTQTRRMRRRLDAARLQTNDHVFGLYDSGAMTEERLIALIAELPPGISEVYCHPATRRWDGVDNLVVTYKCEEEFRGLISPALKDRLDEMGLRPSSFRAALEDAH
jgi:chitin disaccharide deacetylase